MWSHFHLFWPYVLAKSVAQWNPVIIFTCASPHIYVYLEKVSFSIWLGLSLIHKWHLRSLKNELLKKSLQLEDFEKHFKDISVFAYGQRKLFLVARTPTTNVNGKHLLIIKQQAVPEDVVWGTPHQGSSAARGTGVSPKTGKRSDICVELNIVVKYWLLTLKEDAF